MPTEENLVVGLENTISYLKAKSFSDETANLVLQPVMDAKDYIERRQSNKGHWKISEYEYLDCSVCGGSYYTGCDSTEEAKRKLKNGDVYRFCPHCGAEMMVPDQKED